MYKCCKFFDVCKNSLGTVLSSGIMKAINNTEFDEVHPTMGYVLHSLTLLLINSEKQKNHTQSTYAAMHKKIPQLPPMEVRLNHQLWRFK